MARTPVKKLGKVAAAIHAKKLNGLERVTFPETVLPELEYLACLNWYSNVKEPSDAKAYLLEWMKVTGDRRMDVLSKVNEKSIRPTAGWVARLIVLGAQLSTQAIDTFHRLVNDSVRVNPYEVTDKAEIAAVVPNVQKRIVARSGDLIADVESALDHWRTQPFNLYNYLNENSVAPALVKHVLDYYRPLAEELVEAISKKDPALKEAYSYLTKAELGKYAAFVQGIISDGERYAKVTKAATPRKPRARKEVSVQKRLEKLQYLEAFRAKQLKSIAPETILGAPELWLLDTVSMRLTVLRADSPHGLDLKGTTMINFDPKNSFTKRIGRNSTPMIDAVIRGPKTSVKKAFDALKTDTVEANGRINKNTILMKVYK